MKNKFLTLNKPCTENWANMTPDEKGNYCKICSKNVVDFTQLNAYEIGEQMKKAKGSICARVTQRQLEQPLMIFEAQSSFGLPYPKIAAGFLIVTALGTVQPIHAESQRARTEFMQSTDNTVKRESMSQNTTPNTGSSNDAIVLKGIVTSENGKPIGNAIVTFVTVKKLFTANTLEDGTFAIEIPLDLVDDDNVIRVSYKGVKEGENDKNDDETSFRKGHFGGYETTDYVLTKSDMASIYKITAKEKVYYLGGIGSTSVKIIPIVIQNGKEIKYKEFEKAMDGLKSSHSMANKDFLYFNPREAMAIYGKKAKYGLYIVIDKEVK